MNSDTRRAVAYIAARLASTSTSASIYDYEASEWVSISGDVTSTQVSVYDFARGAHVTGTGSNGRYSLYDFGRSGHIQLNSAGARFDGYDFISGHHFNGTVNGGAVSFFDFGRASTTATPSEKDDRSVQTPTRHPGPPGSAMAMVMERRGRCSVRPACASSARVNGCCQSVSRSVALSCGAAWPEMTWCERIQVESLFGWDC